MRDRGRTVSDLVAAAWPERVASAETALQGQLISDNFFSSLGARVVVGRAIRAEDSSTTGQHRVVVLSHDFWERRFNGDAGVVGTELTLNDVVCTIVGVTSEDFIGIGNPPQVPDFWAPLSMQAALYPVANGGTDPGVPVQIVGRVSAHGSPRQAQAELTVLANQFQEMSPAPNGDRTVAVTVEPARFFGGTGDLRFQASVAAVMVCVGLLLIVACANVANMALARASSRQREIGVRLALGASRGRIVRQLVTESIVLASLGGVAGLVAATWFGRWLGVAMTDTIQELFGNGVRLVLHVEPDLRVFGYAFAISLVAGSVAGLLPAAQASMPDLMAALKSDEGRVFGRRISRSRLRAWLIGAQIAAAVTLVVTAGFLTRGLIRSRATEPGFETRRIFIVSYHPPSDPAASTVLVRRLAERLQQLPSIAAVTFVRQAPFQGTWTPPIVVDRDPSAVGAVPVRTLANYVSPTYFDALGIPLVRGRTFSAAEATATAPVAVVSASLSRAFWPNDDPIGRHLKVDMDFRGRMEEFEVVGVAKDVRTANLSRVDPSYVYLLSDPSEASAPSSTDAARFRANTLLIRTVGNTPRALEAVRATVGQIDATLLPELDLVNLDDTYVRIQRLISSVFSTFALVLASLSLALAAVGTYGTMSYLISQRVREIGIRVALGAQRAHILRLVLGQGFTPLAIGAGTGLVAALSIGFVVRAALVAPGTPDFLFGVGTFDPPTLLGLVTLLALVGCLATYVPARRAMRVDPIVALREQ